MIALVVAAFIGVASIHAQIASGRTSPLVQMIADKFGLKTADVQSVFDQYHQNQITARETQYKTNLDNAVTVGKITSAQEQLILQKHQELLSTSQTNRQNMLDLQTWASQNGIPLQYLFGGFGPGPSGFRGHWGTIHTPTP